jgi:hypothetical protein
MDRMAPNLEGEMSPSKEGHAVLPFSNCLSCKHGDSTYTDRIRRHADPAEASNENVSHLSWFSTCEVRQSLRIPMITGLRVTLSENPVAS